ncbi:DUF1552 domain-containing protein [Rhodopirellula sp. MGV]|uniref:DUF1552 domain-containing protein n=1 Tax=Rhodopirellula sp. MGV TaxID=2023130 RepID=UPI000B973032|nr:DUF1552 domain-containing protein [Rhodopirellula sp. MGV]OYP32987.1 hypothetical protein CGZ80_19015 [Rhodopirellula sp. MGV]PNY35355.1 DUF1552 domain-containing protein [Rhodopirellula baltica]
MSNGQKRSLSRRGFLRGSGLTLALPAMASLRGRAVAAETAAQSATAVTSTGAPLRMAFMSIPNGVQQENWFPSDDNELNETMKPLNRLKSDLQVISGLDHINATPGPDGAGDHARANATFLTGLRARKTAGSDIECGISVDQVAAQSIGSITRMPSLELTSDLIRNSGSCDSGYACAYQYNLAWSSPSTPVTPEANPRLVFERLFGSGSRGDRKKNYEARLATKKSVLDFVLEEGRDVKRQLAAADSRKFDEYFSVVRDMERRIEAAEQFKDPPETDEDAPAGIPRDFGDYMTLMYDMLHLAFQTDSTRVATLLLAYDGSNRTFPQLGIPEGHHWLTHSQRDEALAQKVARIDQFYIEHFARFLEKMRQTEDVDGNSLLHNSMIVYGGAIADGNRHTHENLPVILAGQAGGQIETGRYYQAEKQPMSNLYVSMLNLMGIPVDEFGDSNGKLSLS